MAIMALEGFTRFWFSPTDQKDNNDPARFELKPLNSQQLEIVLHDAVIDEDGLKALSPKGIAYALKTGLLNWENINTSQGAFNYSLVNVDRLPVIYRQAIALELLVKALVPEEIEKN